MANIEVNWAIADHISVSEKARDLGFDLRKFDGQPEDVQAFVKKATVDSVIHQIRAAWRECYRDDGPNNNCDFNAVRQGVYVIAIGEGFGVSYRYKCSEVMYIGRGVIANRLRSHLNNWIFDMSRSLRDVPFRFYMQAVGDSRSPNAYKDFEHFILEQFLTKFGEKPLVNKIHGRQGNIAHTFTGNWKKPLDGRGKSHLWEIRPTDKNPWFKEYEDE
ncbi:hypothetical protein [Asticcacaulis sp. EMRT-3]|uniref:hypothetical protein n=1 Tax=Asticcacaulis sp. EMRT-3 TaxID=3040349 RepID=UPI0024AF0FA7|nr:hypothetical protein [Asticcacaulis sp. EMRT-3]MDI7774633.1 hypothetical protein [Asticcacaulis sp. EMRT-3]